MVASCILTLARDNSSYVAVRVWGRFYVSETIMPEAQEHFLTPSARRHTHLFGGLGLTP